jgi:hypothetical protein
MIDKAQIKAGDTIEWSWGFKPQDKCIYVNQISVVEADGRGGLVVKRPTNMLWLKLKHPGFTVSKIIESAEK